DRCPDLFCLLACGLHVLGCPPAGSPVAAVGARCAAIEQTCCTGYDVSVKGGWRVPVIKDSYRVGVVPSAAGRTTQSVATGNDGVEPTHCIRRWWLIRTTSFEHV